MIHFPVTHKYFEGEISKKILTCQWLRCLSWKCYCLDDSCLLFLPRLAVWFKAKQTMFIDLSLKSMYSSDEHSTFEMSWFLSHQEVMEHILESCKCGKGVIAVSVKSPCLHIHKNYLSKVGVSEKLSFLHIYKNCFRSYRKLLHKSWTNFILIQNLDQPSTSKSQPNISISTKLQNFCCWLSIKQLKCINSEKTPGLFSEY